MIVSILTWAIILFLGLTVILLLIDVYSFVTGGEVYQNWINPPPKDEDQA